MAYGFTYRLPTITGTHTYFPVVMREFDFPASAIDGGASSILNGGGIYAPTPAARKQLNCLLRLFRLLLGVCQRHRYG